MRDEVGYSVDVLDVGVHLGVDGPEVALHFCAEAAEVADYAGLTVGVHFLVDGAVELRVHVFALFHAEIAAVNPDKVGHS